MSCTSSGGMNAEEGTQGREWYWVAAVYKSVHLDRPRKRNLHERLVFLLSISVGEDPQQAAYALARTKEVAYENAKGKRLRWVLEEIEDIQPLHDTEVDSGTEVYWTFFERVGK